jgi:tripartite ATP-independent transporter DctM subunit
MKIVNRAISLLNNLGVLSRWTNTIGAVIIFIMVGMTFTDVIMRYVFSRPIDGALEMVEVMLIVAVFFTIAHTYNQKGHVAVDLITVNLKPKAHLIMDFITTLLGLGLFIIIIWRTLALTILYFERNAVHSNNFLIPSGPFAAVIVFGSLIMGLLLLRDFLRDIVEAVKLGLKPIHWFLMLGIPILLMVLAAFWMQPGLWHLSLPIVGILGIIVFLILLMTGMPIAFSLFISGFIFISHIRGIDTALNTLGREIYTNTGDFTWATVAFFVLMGYFCLHAGFGKDLYVLFHRWIGRFPGGLAMATTASCTAFAAIVGDSISSIATMTSVAMPEMKRYNYDKRLATGSIAGGSIIGPIIPPSIPFIIYGILTQVSIGKLFIAGILPGLLLGVAFIVTIYIWCRINPRLGPPAEGATWRQRFGSLTGIGPIIALFILVIGGIYGGVFSPAEGGAIGAAGALIIGLIMRRFTWRSFFQSLIDSAKVLSMLLLIINGAILFTRFVAWCNLSGVVSGAMAGLGWSPTAVIIVVLFIFFALGFIIDVLTLTLIGVPIMHPVAVGLGIDPLWFATLMVLVLTLGTLTPPVGINLFTMKGMAPDIPIGTIYRGAIPFVIAAVVVIVIVFLFPPLATWLPGIMK